MYKSENPVNGQSKVRGVTLVELLIGMVVASIVLTGLYRLFMMNTMQSSRIADRNDLRSQMTLGANRISKSLTLAGIGMDRIDNIFLINGAGTDTLTVYFNRTFQQDSVERTTLLDTAQAGTLYLLTMDSIGFTGSEYLGITDGVKWEYRRMAVTGSYGGGIKIRIDEPLLGKYNPGEPDIYSVTKHVYTTNSDDELLLFVDDVPQVVARSILSMRLEFKDKNGNSTGSLGDMRMVTFSLTGKARTPGQSTFTEVSFSSTVIPRNSI